MSAWDTVIGQRTMDSINSMARVIDDNTPTLRDQFAMATLNGFLSNPTVDETPEAIVVLAYRYADAMLEARKEKK